MTVVVPDVGRPVHVADVAERRGRRSRSPGTPVRSGRTPVIIITWLGMVSITGIDLARG